MCRKADHKSIVEKLEEHVRSHEKQLEVIKQGQRGSDPVHGSAAEKETALLVKEYHQFVEYANKEMDHMEKMEALKLEQQRDTVYLRLQRAANASIMPLDESLLLPPPELKGHPIESILEINNRLGEEQKALAGSGGKTPAEIEQERQEKKLEEELVRELEKDLRVVEHPDKDTARVDNFEQWQENSTLMLNNSKDAASARSGEGEAATNTSKMPEDVSSMDMIQEGATRPGPVNKRRSQDEVQFSNKRLRRENTPKSF